MRESPRAFPLNGMLGFGIAFLTLSLMATASFAAQDDCIDYGNYLRWIGTVNVPALGISVHAPYAYVAAESSGLQILDITGPDLPTIVGSVDTPGRAWDLAISDGYAYVIDGASLQVIDVSNPALPALAGSVDIPSYAWSIAISGSYVYLAAGHSGLLVIDVTNPASPALARIVDTPYSARGVTLFGNFAYVADGGGIHVVDITDPSKAVLTKTVATQSAAQGAAVSGSYLYVAKWTGLEIMDIANPGSPASVGSVTTPGSSDVEVSGNFAYMASSSIPRRLLVIDISNAAAPEVVGSMPTAGALQSVAVGDAIVYLADGKAGLQVVDNTNPASPGPVGSVGTENGLAVAVDASHAYVVANVHFRVIDIEKPSEPSIVTTLDTPNYYGSAIAISGSFAYVPVSKVYSGPTPPPGPNDALNVVDISDPLHPALVTSLALPDHGSGIAISGSFAYIAAYSSLLVVNIENPIEPQIVGSVETPGTAFEVAAAGDYAYVADNKSGLQVIDVSNPTSPQIVGSVDVPGSAFDVALSGSFVFIVDFFHGLQVIDASSPSSPQLIASVHTPIVPRAVSVSGLFAYVVGAASLYVIEITNPTVPRLIGMTDLPREGSDLAAESDYVYLPTNFAGFFIFPSQCNVPTPVILTHFEASTQNNGILLDWDTSVESNLAGFHVLRSTHREEGFERINDGLITSPYRYLDMRVAAGTTYYYELEAVDRSGNREVMGLVSATAGEVMRSRLGPASPNPFVTESTEISFTLAKGGPVVLRILDISGRQVRVLFDESMERGERSVIWDGKNDRGELVAGGVYLYTIDAPELKESRRVVKIR